MAVNFSKKEVFFAYKNFYGIFYPNNNQTIVNKIIIVILRNIYPLLRKFFNLKNYIISLFTRSNLSQNFNNNISTKDLSSYHNHLSEKGWCFIENFFDEETHSNLLTAWPSKYFFSINEKPTKYYSTGFFSKSKTDEKKLRNFPYFKKIYNYIFGEKFKLNVSKLIDNNISSDYLCYTVLSSVSGFKNYLIPHKDGISASKKRFKNFNFIYFAEGNNEIPEFSGATGIFKDNEFQSPIFIPHNMTNSCLVYDSSDSFFHGFKSLKKEGYRKVITFQFFHKENLENKN